MAQIIYQINFLYLEELKKRVGDDFFRIARMSIIEEGDTKVTARCHVSCGDVPLTFLRRRDHASASGHG